MEKSLDRRSAFVYEEGSLEFEQDSKGSYVPVKMLDTEIQRKEDEEETAFDRDFIKVEKETIDIKDSSQVRGAVSVEEQQSISKVPLSDSPPKIEMEEAQETIKELEIRLEAVLKDLHGSESERAQLLSQMASANEKLCKREEHSQQLELVLKNLKDESESKHNLQLQSIQKAQKDYEALQSELLDVKKSFDETSHDLVASRMKTEELELDLSTAVNKAKKYEELSREKDSHAEIQSKKASEYEKLVEDATLRTKEMEDKIAALQEELKALHSKTAEDQQVKEEHSSATSDLLKVQEELVISKLQVEELEQRVTSDGATIEKLTQDLNYCKASEEHAKKDLMALENLLSASKDELQVKTTSLQEVESKYEREVKINEDIESTLRNQHKQVKNLQEKLVVVTGEKEALEAVSAELNASLTKAKETCELLENKLSESDQNFSKADSLLTQTMSYNFEIEQKLKALEELHRESGMAAETATQRKLELEDLIRSSNAAEEELKALLRETELKLVSAEQRNLELEQQLNLMELKCNDRDQELNELKVKTSELTTLLKSSEEESALSRCHFQASEERVNQLELSLNNSSKRILELEQELKDLADKCTEHESQAGVAHQRSIELEDLIQKSHSKSIDAESKVAELEIVLEATKYRVQELEEQLSIGFVKYRDAEEELVQFQAKVSELKAVAEAFQLRSDGLEIALQSATDKEKEFRSQLKSITEEKNKFEQSSHNSSQQHLERENLLKVLQFELNSEKEKLEGVEKLLGAKDVREQELLEKLRSTEEKLEHQGREVENASARSLELESLHETLAKDSEVKLQETLVSLSQKDSEAKQLSMKLQTIEEEATFYQTQAAEATEKATFYQNQADEATQKATSLKAELEASSVVQLSLEETIAQLKIKIKGAEIKVEQASSEYEMIANTNTKLKEELVEYEANVNKLQELVNSITAERDKTAEQLASHAKIISELTDKHARGLDLHLETESRVKETEEKLLEAIEQLKIRDSETKILNEKLLSLESKVTMYEKQASEAAHVAENRKVELDVALLKIKKIEETAEEFQRQASQFEIENESLATTNLKLTHDLASYETKLNELQKALDAVLSDKEETLGQLISSRKTVGDLGQQLAAEGERLQSQISSVMEENYLLSEMHQNTKKDLQGIIRQLEGQLNEQKAKESSLNGHIEDLKADLMVIKSEMQAKIVELEQRLVLVDNQFKEEFDRLKLVATEKELLLESKLEETTCKLKERDDLAAQLAQLQTELHHAHTTLEQKEADSKMELERQASIKLSLGEFEAKHQHNLAFEKKIEELEQKLQIADLQHKEKVETSMKQSLLQVETEHQHVLLLQDKVEELEKKLQIAEMKCQEKDREEGRKLALANVELDGLKNKLNETAKLEKKIKELENELQLTSAKQNEGALEAEGQHDVDIKSRDFSLGMTKPLRRKSKKRSEGSHQPAGTSATTIEEHSLGTTLKLILGIALVSMVIGVILGKRY